MTTRVHRWQPYADHGQWPKVVLRDDLDQPRAAVCPACGAAPAVKHNSGGRFMLANHGPRGQGCDGSFMPVPDHGPGCWGRHLECARTRVAELGAALGEVLEEFVQSTCLTGREEQRTGWVDAARVDGWRAVLGVPGAAKAGDAAPGDHETTLGGSQ